MPILSSKYFPQVLEQIRWEKYRRDYWKVDDLNSLEAKIRKSNDEIELTDIEINLLLNTTSNSSRKISSYDYQNLDDPESLRYEAIKPVMELHKHLKELKNEAP